MFFRTAFIIIVSVKSCKKIRSTYSDMIFRNRLFINQEKKYIPMAVTVNPDTRSFFPH